MHTLWLIYVRYGTLRYIKTSLLWRWRHFYYIFLKIYVVVKPVELKWCYLRLILTYTFSLYIYIYIYIYIYTTCTASGVVNISASWTSFFGDVSVAQLVASMSGVVLGGVVEVVGSNLATGKIFTASIGSVDSLYPSVFIYCLNLHQFLILCSSKAMMFVKLYFRTSDIYLISLVSLDPSGFHLRPK